MRKVLLVLHHAIPQEPLMPRRLALRRQYSTEDPRGQPTRRLRLPPGRLAILLLGRQIEQ